MQPDDLPDPDDVRAWAAIRVSHKRADGEDIRNPDALTRKLAADWRRDPGDPELAATRRRARAEALGEQAEGRREMARRHEARRRDAARVLHARGCSCDRRSLESCPDLPALELPKPVLQALTGSTGKPSKRRVPMEDPAVAEERRELYQQHLEARYALDFDQWALAVGGELAEQARWLETHRPRQHAEIVALVRTSVDGTGSTPGMRSAFEVWGAAAWQNTVVQDRARSLYEWHVRQVYRAATAGREETAA